MLDVNRLIDSFAPWLGQQQELGMFDCALADAIGQLGAIVVGAHHICCSDETELDCLTSFHQNISRSLLPPLKPGAPTAFGTRNLGARYEPGSLAVCEHHYALAPTDRPKLVLVKISSHAAMTGQGPTAQFGTLNRYGQPSRACGALHAMLDRLDRDFVCELRQQFSAGGVDRLALLLEQTPEQDRSLLVSVIAAQLQARRAACEAMAIHSTGPTAYLVIAAVTLNRVDRDDAELLCGMELVDRRGDQPQHHAIGLGDDPTKLRCTRDAAGVAVGAVQ